MDIKRILRSCLFLTLGMSALACADDTDLFLVNPAITAERPNVLIVLDNSANWNTPFTAEKSALVSTVTGLDDKFNVGLMMFVETGGGNDNIDGSYVRFGVRQMTSTNKTALSSMVNNLHILNDKSNNAVYGLTMAEAYYYFGGTTSHSGYGKVKRDYAGNTVNNPLAASLPGNAFSSAASSTYVSPIADACQKNFIIFISNGPANDNASSTTEATSRLTSAGGLTSTISLTPNGSESNVADEWARFLSSSDVNNSYSGTQSIVTYTVDVNPGTTGQGPAHTALLKSMALQGKGKYFAVNGDATAIADALNKIFLEVQAINSVYASSTLPVSVNVRGTYLNQVYMGVFRPDGNSSPRWTGNVKQYNIARDAATSTLFLSDKNGVAIENASSGFVSPNITSFWTTSSTFWNSSYYPDAQGSGGTSDAPDGDLVEKGGAAQHLRNNYVYDTTNLQPTRSLYTCTGTCASGDTLSGFPFAKSNASLTDASFGLSPAKTVTSLTRSGSTVTATVTAHGLSTGQTTQISGAAQSDYNGSFPVTVLDANTFTYTISVSPASPATGTITATLPATAPVAISSITRSGTTVTVNAAGNTYVSGQQVSISGATPTAYNGTWTITCSGSCNPSFTFPIAEGPATPGGSGTAAVSGYTTRSIETSTANPNPGIVRSGLTVTVTTTANHGFPNSGTVTIAGASPTDYNGTWSFTKTGNKTFTFSLASTTPTTPATVTGTVTAPGTSTTSVTALTLALGSGASGTATATTSGSLTAAPFNLTVGNTYSITVSGASESQYNGTFNATVTAANTFTYGITTSPSTPATGTILMGSTLTKNDLINWVRGQNVRNEDNPTLSMTGVRGYLHGDVLHSRPAVINYNRSSQPANRDIVVYYGSNDGIFHAAKGGQDDADGGEKWGFIPTELFNKLPRLYDASPSITSSNPKPYFIDGPISAYQKDANSDGQYIASDNDLVYLYLGLRRGGRFIYALNVSDPDSPRFLWKKSNTDTGFGELGQTWSELTPAKIRASSDPVLIFGAGYDAAANDPNPATTATMGRGVFVVNAMTGALIWHAGPGPAPTLPTGAVYKTVSGMNYSMAADMMVVDSDKDINGYSDRIYAADTGGNVWRVNIDNADPTNWTVAKIAALGGSGADGRKFLYRPDVVSMGTTDAILIGSGDREHPFDTSVQNRFYMLKDDHAIDATMASPMVDNNATHNDLCDADAVNLSTCLTSSKGWYLNLGTGEKVVGGAVTLAGTVFFGTNLPASAATPGICTSNLGEARLYEISFLNAAAVRDLNYSSTITTADRYKIRPGGGYPPSPVPVVVEIGGKQYETVISGTQLQTPVTPPRGQRFRTYWNMLLDY